MRLTDASASYIILSEEVALMLQQIIHFIAHHGYFFLAGILFGLANVIPGVSGGTMAVVFGVYERIIGLIANLKKNLKKEIPFLLAFGSGAAVGVFAFANLMDYILHNHPVEANAFFIGVILGSLPMLIKSTFLYGKKKPKYKLNIKNILPMVITFAIMIPMALSGNDSEAKSAAESAVSAAGISFSLGRELLYVLYGIIAVTTMIIPGISGSFVMLLIGFYGTIISAVHNLNMMILLPFGIGCVIGIFTVAKLIKLLLARYPHQTYSAILGFVLGSILCIFPGWKEMLNIWPILMVACGIGTMYLCSLIKEQPQ